MLTTAMTRHLWLGLATAAVAVAVAIGLGVFSPQASVASSLRVRLNPGSEVSSNDRLTPAVERLAVVDRVLNTLAEIIAISAPGDVAVTTEATVDDESNDVTITAYGGDGAANANALAAAVAKAVPVFIESHHLFDVEIIDSGISHEQVMSTKEAASMLITIVLGAFAATYAAVAAVRFLGWPRRLHDHAG
jgi:hypothetical protein